jgi:hypothetical protein
MMIDFAPKPQALAPTFGLAASETGERVHQRYRFRVRIPCLVTTAVPTLN